MAKKLVICSAIFCALFLPFLSSSSSTASYTSSQQQSKNLFLHPESQDAKSLISGRKHLEEIIIHMDQARRFDQAKTGPVNRHEINGEGEEDKGSIYTADYNRVRTHSSPLPKHPQP